MNPKIIKSEEEHEAALAHIETLMDAEPGSPEEDELELWALLVEQYEKEHFPIGPPDPIEAIKFRMDQMGLKQKDLTKFISAKSKVSEVLNRKRGLSLSMIRQLHQNLQIPAEVLVKEPQFEIRSNTTGRKVKAAAKTRKRAQSRKATRSKKEKVEA
jgi:HTH-type transcriptional regulator/antitoxin HigA